MAINLCTDRNLKICILLAIGCSLRLGEILGLQWKHVHIDEKSLEDNSSTLEVKQELKRCYKNSLEDLEKMNRGNVYFKFPDVKEYCNTSLVLKIPKTESSIRTVYIPNSVAVALQAQRAMQEKRKELMHGLYSDYEMVCKRKTPDFIQNQAFFWSCYPDSNWGPHPYQGCALPAEL